MEKIIEASYGAADAITSSLKDFGGSMGNGVRELIAEAHQNGFSKGFDCGMLQGFVAGKAHCQTKCIIICAGIAILAAGTTAIIMKKKYAKEKQLASAYAPVGNSDISTIEDEEAEED